MFIVKDVERLKEYGFDNTYKNIYTKEIAQESGVSLQYIVNPLNTTCQNNELLLYVTTDVDEVPADLDFIGDLTLLAKMLQDGVIFCK